MAYDAHKNFAGSLVATAPSPATSGTSLVVTAAGGALFPTPPFNAVICPANTNPTTANAEIVRVTVIATDTFTITRAQESTSARTVLVGDQIFNAPTVKAFTDIETSTLVSANNLSDVSAWATARSNIGVYAGSGSASLGALANFAVGTATVSHGAPWTPSLIIASLVGGGTYFGNYVVTGADTITGANFRLVVENISGASQTSGSVNFVYAAFR